MCVQFYFTCIDPGSHSVILNIHVTSAQIRVFSVFSLFLIIKPIQIQPWPLVLCGMLPAVFNVFFLCFLSITLRKISKSKKKSARGARRQKDHGSSGTSRFTCPDDVFRELFNTHYVPGAGCVRLGPVGILHINFWCFRYSCAEISSKTHPVPSGHRKTTKIMKKH